MIKKLLQTDDDLMVLILRLMLGVVIFPHGMQKLFGWFGGYGFVGTMGFFTGKLGIPAFFAVLAIIAESFGSVGLITGLFTRIAAFGVTVTIAVAAFMLHMQNGFFMNWFGNQKGEGFEYHLLFVVIGIAILFRGGGKWSADRVIAARIG